LSVIMLSVIMLSVIMLSVIMLSVIMLSVIMLSGIMLSGIMLSVVAPPIDQKSHPCAYDSIHLIINYLNEAYYTVQITVGNSLCVKG
jgi:hypothetical protein